MAEPTSHTYFSQRLRLHYLDWGNPDRPPLLLLHGSRDHAHNWDWVARRLQDRYHLIAPDLRGHGDSQWSLGSTYAPAELMSDVAQLVHQKRIAPVRVIGHSLGAIVGLRYAGTFPEEVMRLVVVDGTGDMAVHAAGRPSTPERMRRWVEAQRSLAGRLPRHYESLEEAFGRLQDAHARRAGAGVVLPGRPPRLRARRRPLDPPRPARPVHGARRRVSSSEGDCPRDPPP